MTAFQRLFDPTSAFDHSVTIFAVTAIGAALLVSSFLVRGLIRFKKISQETYQELLARTRSWYVLAAAMIIPILLGAAWVYGFFLLLSLFCFREYSQATGLSKAKTATFAAVTAILITYFAVIDHWKGLFSSSWAFGICWIAVTGLVTDNPHGYMRRVGLAIFGYALFGISLGHLAYLGNDMLFRPMLLWILLCTELNDVFAYLTGKTWGRRKLLPNTSPNKTWAGAIGAIVLTTTLAAIMAHFVFFDTELDRIPHLIMLGLMISILGQCGDLVVSSIKRDLGVKDMAAVIPGHGGLLDRFDSLLLVAPIVFHYINFFKPGGIGSDQAVRIISSG